jgi:hypothetical protein
MDLSGIAGSAKTLAVLIVFLAGPGAVAGDHTEVASVPREHGGNE